MKDAPDIESTTTPTPKRRRGAQPGNRLALKHGRYAGEMIAFKAYARTLIHAVNTRLAQLKAARAPRDSQVQGMHGNCDRPPPRTGV